MPFKSYRTSMYRKRAKNSHRPGGDILQDFNKFAAYVTSEEFPGDILTNAQGSRLNLISIEGSNESCVMLIFHNVEHSRSVAATRWLGIDGTFDATPKIKGCQQLLTLMARKKANVSIYLNMHC